MQEIRLKSRVRKGVGKKTAHRLRALGEVPAILYGHKEEPVALAVPEHEIWHILHNAVSEHLILKLEIDESREGEVMTLVRDVQHHPVTGDILHFDLQRISLDEQVKVGVPVELEGQARGVKEFGGILDHGVREVMIRCRSAEIPDALHIDVSHLEIGQSVHISELVALYPNLEFLDDFSITLAHVSPPKKVEEPVAEEVVAAAAEEVEAEAPAEEQPEGEGEES